MSVSATSSSQLKLDFMNLLVTQMQHQNPLEPMSNADMTAQLAQFSSLEQMENLNQSFQQILDSTEQDFANSLLGKNVSFIDGNSFNEDGSQGVRRTGVVEEVDIVSEQPWFRVVEYDSEGNSKDEYIVPRDSIMTIGKSEIEV